MSPQATGPLTQSTSTTVTKSAGSTDAGGGGAGDSTAQSSKAAATTLPPAQQSRTQITVETTIRGTTFTTTTPGYITVASYESSLYYYTTSGPHTSIVCTSTLTQGTILQVTASNEDAAQSRFTAMLRTIQKQVKPTYIPITKDTVVPCSGGLSKGDKAGIGVGATIGGLLILALLFFLFWRRRKRRHRAGGRPYVDEKAELEGDQAGGRGNGGAEDGATESDGRDVYEAPQKVEEIGIRVSRYELEGDWRGIELT